MSNKPLPNRVLITGGASGIGFANAQQLGRAGAKVAVFDMNTAQTEAARNELDKEQVEALAFPGDVRRRDNLAHAVDTVVTQMGRA